MHLWGKNLADAKEALAQAERTAQEAGELAERYREQSQADAFKHAQAIAALKNEHAQAIQALREEAKRLADKMAEMERARGEELARVEQQYAVETARLRGQIDSNAEDAAKWRWLRNHFTWHSGGKCETPDGEVYRLNEALRTAEGCNFRVPTKPDWEPLWS